MDLGDAPDAVGVLYPGAVLMGGDDGAIGSKPAEIFGGEGLARMGPDRVNFGVELCIGSHEDLQAHTRRNVSGLHQLDCLMHHQCPYGRHHLGTVYQCQPLGLLQLEGGQTGPPHSLPAGETFTFVKSLAFPD